MSRISFSLSKVWLLSSVREGDGNLVRYLDESSLQSVRLAKPSLAVQLISIWGREDLYAALEHIRESAQLGLSPLVHFDMHGNEHGIELANSDYVTWGEMYEEIVDINIASRLNLVLTVSSCYGGLLARATKLTSAAPFFALIGPVGETTFGAAISAYDAFFNTLFDGGELDSAFIELEKSVPASEHYQLITAGHVFSLGWSAYLKDLQDSGKMTLRVNRMAEEAVRLTGCKNLISKFRKIARTELKHGVSEAFEDMKCRFFMLDSFPENVERFSYSLSEVASTVDVSTINHR